MTASSGCCGVLLSTVNTANVFDSLERVCMGLEWPALPEDSRRSVSGPPLYILSQSGTGK